MTYTLWEYDGQYIKGTKVYTYQTLTAAKKRARKIDGFNTLEKSGSDYFVLDIELRALGMIESTKDEI